LLAEEPLLIQLGDQPLVTLMRTPGNEVDLALGWLLTEGVVASADEVGAIAFCKAAADGVNVVRVSLAGGSEPARVVAPHRRVFSSCSICGAEQIEEVARDLRPFSLERGRLSCSGITAMAGQMRQRQAHFRTTGASHAAGIAPRPLDDASLAGMIVREDIGRHNALDKAVGAAAALELDLRQRVLCLSGRLSFEMVAKAARAGVADVVAVSAPTALAVDLAVRLGMFLAGFARGEDFTVYAGIEALT
jgi:FdhD protein